MDKAKKISQLEVGSAILYEYDFGSTTEIVVTIVKEIERPKQREKVQLLARNAPAQVQCSGCGASATYVNAWEDELFCDKCAENVEDEDELLPIINSPRCGVCGYDGGLDIWTFDPNKSFPQPQMKNRQVRLLPTTCTAGQVPPAGCSFLADEKSEA